MHDYPNTKRRLSDILSNGESESIRTQWDKTEAAADFAPLPSGTYVAHVQSVELFNAKTGTPGVKIQFRVAEGEHAGRFIFHDLWLTPAAMPQTKRDCLKLGLDSLEKLENATVPPGRIRCNVRVTLRTEDNGEQHNRVRRFDVLGMDEPERDPFAPSDETNGDFSVTSEAPTEVADRDDVTPERSASGDVQAAEPMPEHGGGPRGDGSSDGTPNADTSFQFGLNAKPKPDPTAWAKA